MGLFATLSSQPGDNNDESTFDKNSNANSNSNSNNSNSIQIPTVVQMYCGTNANQMISMNDVSDVSGYTSLTFQAVQVGASKDEEVHGMQMQMQMQMHSTPDLGVWNCRVDSSVSANSNSNSNSNSSNSNTNTNANANANATGETDKENNGNSANKNTKNINTATTTSNTNSSSNNDNNNAALVDSLLAKLAKAGQTSSSVYCWTVDLSDVTDVEPTLSALQAALVRHLIEHPTKEREIQTLTQTQNENENDTQNENDNQDKQSQTTRTTSLYDLQTVQFGLANTDKAPERSIAESSREVKVGLMLCALMPPEASGAAGIAAPGVAAAAAAAATSSEEGYFKQQARALVVYHLRKFASALNAALCFVERPSLGLTSTAEEEKQKQMASASASANTSTNEESAREEEKEESLSANANANASASASNANANNPNAQSCVSYDTLAQLWRDMASGIPVWEADHKSPSASASASTQSGRPQSSTASASASSSTALYGPGAHQEDLIESVLLRNASYPGHWDATKDSLWVALPTNSTKPRTHANSTGTSTSTGATASATGDEGWLTQLRESMASALPPSEARADDSVRAKTPAKAKADSKSTDKDGEVSSFFESLLKSP